MTLAFAVIGLMTALVLLAARLGDTQRQLDQARRESAEQARSALEEQAAYQYGTAVTVACLLAGLATAYWYAPPGQPRAARFKAGARAGATDRGAGR